MIVVPNQLYSFHYSQVPGFDRIYELARQHSYAPAEVDDEQHLKMTPDHRLFSRRATLHSLPEEEAILQRELELSKSEGDESFARPLREVETPEQRQLLNGIAPVSESADAPSASSGMQQETRRAEVPHRHGSGYVKLDERKSRLKELTQEVSRFFDSDCRCQGDYWYPRGGFRDWHTNKYDKSGWRLYIVDSDAAGESYFGSRIQRQMRSRLSGIALAHSTFS